MYGWHNGGWDGGAWVAMIVVMVAFWAAVAAVVLVALRHRHHGDAVAPPPPGGPAPAGTDAALRVLEDRFARGEIDAEEFTQRRDLLRAR